jgi:hypothetical protein
VFNQRPEKVKKKKVKSGRVASLDSEVLKNATIAGMLIAMPIPA